MDVRRAGWAVLMAGLGLSVAAAAAPGVNGGAKPMRGTTYASLAELPDLSGIWQMDDASIRTTSVASLRPPLKPSLEGKVLHNPQGEPSQLCKTRVGMPIVMGAPLPFEILLTPGRVTVIFESDGKVRRIYTDDRPRPADYYPQAMGYSVGRWEGDTLVVTTTDIDAGIPITPFGGVNHGPRIRIVERFKLLAPGVMHVSTATTDPDTLTRPWVVERTYLRRPHDMIFDYSCEQNNRESVDANGVQHVDLTPPP